MIGAPNILPGLIFTEVNNLSLGLRVRALHYGAPKKKFDRVTNCIALNDILTIIVFCESLRDSK